MTRTFFYEGFNGEKRLVAEFNLNGYFIKALIDTGASRNFFCNQLKPLLSVDKKVKARVMSFHGHTKVSYGVAPFKVNGHGHLFDDFYMLSLEHIDVNCVLGLPFFLTNKINIDFAKISKNPLIRFDFEFTQ